jgi:hypothetical protein
MRIRSGSALMGNENVVPANDLSSPYVLFFFFYLPYERHVDAFIKDPRNKRRYTQSM